MSTPLPDMQAQPPVCGECKEPLVSNDPNDPSGFPYRCPKCEIIYDHEDLDTA